MTKKLKGLYCLLLALVMAISAVGCTSCSKKTPNKKNSSKQSSSQQSEPADTPTDDNGDSGDIGDPDDTGNIDIPNINDQTGINIPEWYYSTKSVLPEDDIDLPDLPDDPIDDGEIGRGVYTSPIQMKGKAVSSNKRVFNVDFNNVVWKDYRGFGSNLMPSGLMPDVKTPGNTVWMELDRKRYTAIEGSMYRMWFQVDWITTTKEKNPTREDYENNIDYKNYINGIYDFDSEKMQSVYEYLDMMKTAGSAVSLNYSWKIGSSIQTWFAFPGVDIPKASAPYDLDAYAKSCAALMKELYVNRGYTNVDKLTFYNEPGQGYDYVTYVDDKAYWVKMVDKVDKALKKEGIRDKIEVWSAEENSIYNNHHAFTDYIHDHAVPYIDVVAAHYYYGTHKEENDYETAYSFFNWLRSNYYKKPFYITEGYGGTYGNITTAVDGLNERTVWKNWEDSNASYLIVTANTGIRAFLNWGFSGAALSDPSFFEPNGGWADSWYTPNENEAKLNRVNLAFLEIAMITNNIKDHSDVLMSSWTGDDVRCAAFRSQKTGDFTILIEANGSNNASVGTEYEVKNTTSRDITVNLLNNNKNLKLYKYHFNPDAYVDRDTDEKVLGTQINPHATMISPELLAGTYKSKFTDTIGKEYGVYVYTTYKPKSQVEISCLGGEEASDSVVQKCMPGGRLNFSARLIDCNANDSVVWSISESITANGNAGTIDQNGVYTAAANAAQGDKIAIRASLKSNPKKIFDAVIIHIQ